MEAGIPGRRRRPDGVVRPVPRPVALIGLFRNQIRDYTERLLRTLHYPPVLLPTHWDNFERPYEDGPHDLRDIPGEPGSLDTFVRELKRVSRRSRVVVLDFFETFEC